MFRLGKSSMQQLEGVHPALVTIVQLAIQITTQDFTVLDGVRTIEEQKEMVLRGVSQTMHSKHLPQADGFAHAVDLVPWINGRPRWEWPAIFPIAEAVRTAAREAHYDIRWGGCWDRALNDIHTSPQSAMEAYAARRRQDRKRVFLDGPHFELMM